MKISTDELAARHPFPQWRFLQLTLAICFWMIVYPRLERTWVAHFVLQLVLFDIMLITVWANQGWTRIRPILVFLWLLSVGASVIGSLDLPHEWLRINKTTQGLLHLPILAACAAGVLAFVFRSERPTLDGIFATVVTYLLVAMIFAQLYMIALAWNPDALHLVVPLDQLTPQARAGQLMYFSVVTLSTVGYGDILPNSELTRMIAAIEAVLGQFYVAVIVAVFVGMYAAQYQADAAARHRTTRDD
jgi:hypothetical protein